MSKCVKLTCALAPVARIRTLIYLFDAGRRFNEGDTVSCYVDMEAGSLRFALNTQLLGVELRGIRGPVVTAVSISGHVRACCVYFSGPRRW